jgi:transcriptional regulator with XRE-family HTH domain
MKKTWYENMKSCREQYGYLQKELSDKLGISERTLQRYEAGESEPTASILLKLSQIYDTSIDRILGNITNSNINAIKIEQQVKQIEANCNNILRAIYDYDDSNNI